MKLIESRVLKQFDNLVNLSKLNDKLLIYSRSLHSQFALGVFYMLFAGINTTLIERGMSGGVGQLADSLSINPYYIIIFAYLMSIYCFLRDRLPIHYAIGTIPIVIYGLVVGIETINGNIQMTGLLAALYLLTIPYLAVIGVVNRYLLKRADHELKQIKSDLREIKSR